MTVAGHWLGVDRCTLGGATHGLPGHLVHHRGAGEGGGLGGTGLKVDVPGRGGD